MAPSIQEDKAIIDRLIEERRLQLLVEFADDVRTLKKEIRELEDREMDLASSIAHAKHELIDRRVRLKEINERLIEAL